MLKPDPDVAARLYLRLIARDPIAPSDLAEAYLEPLIEAVRGRLGDLPDQTVVDDAVMDTLRDFPKEPERCTGPDRLWTYLFLDALRDAQNALDKQHRRDRRLRTVPLDVADSSGARNESVEETVLRQERSSYVPEGVDIQKLKRDVEAILSDPVDLRLVELTTARVRGHRPYAEAMGIAHLSEQEQKEMVNRARGRLRTALRRLGARLA